MVQKNSGNCASPKNIPELSSFNKKQNPFNSQASHDISGPSCFITPSLMAENFWHPLDLDRWSGFGEKSGQTNKQSHKDTKPQRNKRLPNVPYMGILLLFLRSLTFTSKVLKLARDTDQNTLTFVNHPFKFILLYFLKSYSQKFWELLFKIKKIYFKSYSPKYI